MKHTLAVILLTLATVLYGCANLQTVLAPGGGTTPQKLRFTATGYGSVSTFEGYTAGQRRLLAMRAAKLDAYRSLAEQVYGVRIKGNTTVAAMVAQNDSFRVYLDAYLRGARVVSVTPMAEGNYETEIEIELPADFWRTPPMAMPSVNAATPANGAPGTVNPVLASSGYNRSFYYAD